MSHIQSHMRADTQWQTYLPAFCLRGLLSNSTCPQTVYRTCNIVHRGMRDRWHDLWWRHINGTEDGRTFRARPHTMIPFWGWKKVRRLEGSPSVLCFGGTHNQQRALVSICPQWVKEIKMCLITFTVGGLSSSGNSRFDLWHRRLRRRRLCDN